MTTEMPEVLFVCVHNAGRSLGRGDACPIYPGKRYEDWTVDDPAGQDLETVRRIRDEIDVRVQRLIGELLG